MKTLAEKLATIRTAQAAWEAAVAELVVGAGPGDEVLQPGESIPDLAGETSYANVGGALVRSRIVLVGREAPSAS